MNNLTTKDYIKLAVPSIIIIFAIYFNSSKTKELSLGDKLLGSFGIPAWSNGHSGYHYTFGIMVLLILLALYLLKKANPSKAIMERLILFFIVVAVIINVFFV